MSFWLIEKRNDLEKPIQNLLIEIHTYNLDIRNKNNIKNLYDEVSLIYRLINKENDDCRDLLAYDKDVLQDLEKEENLLKKLKSKLLKKLKISKELSFQKELRADIEKYQTFLVSLNNLMLRVQADAIDEKEISNDTIERITNDLNFLK